MRARKQHPSPNCFTDPKIDHWAALCDVKEGSTLVGVFDGPVTRIGTWPQDNFYQLECLTPGHFTLAAAEDDEVLVMTMNGLVVRTGVGEIRQMGRSVQGVRVMTPQKSDRVIAAARVEAEPETEEPEGDGEADEDVEDEDEARAEELEDDDEGPAETQSQ